MDRKRLVILISGSGSNLQAIIDASIAGTVAADISCVISNRKDAGGIHRAQNAGISTTIIDHTDYADREAFDAALMRKIDQYDPTVVVLAGFMRILSDSFIEHYQGRLINIHPSLLPAYKGLDTHRRVLEDGAERHGASVHFVSEELDSGCVVLQAEVTVEPEDDIDSLAARVLEQEHRIYPIALSWIIDGRLELRGTNAYFDGEAIQRAAMLDDEGLKEPVC